VRDKYAFANSRGGRLHSLVSYWGLIGGGGVVAGKTWVAGILKCFRPSGLITTMPSHRHGVAMVGVMLEGHQWD